VLVGPYRFTVEDARNTVSSARTILSQMSEGREHLLANARSELESLSSGIDTEHLDAEGARRLLVPVWNIIMSATPTLCAVAPPPFS